MSLFTSDRERRLWLWTLALMVAIYSTLGPARMLADVLREHNLLRISFIAILILIVGIIIWRWIKQPPGWREIGVALAVAFAYWMVWVRMDSWEERTHLIEYGIVAALIHQALLERVRNGCPVPMPAVITIVATALLGLLDEGIQWVLPNRFFDFRDVFFNALAGFMVTAARLAMMPQQRPGWRVWFLWLMAVSFGWGEGMYWGWYSFGDPQTLQTIPTDILGGYAGVVTGGLLIGVLQWLVLRRQVARAIWWLGASLGGCAIVGVVMFGVGVFNVAWGWIAGVSLFGTVVGVLQWLILRGEVPHAAWWILVSTVGWIVGMPLGDMAGPPALGAAYGAITGTALVWLLRQGSSNTLR